MRNEKFSKIEFQCSIQKKVRSEQIDSYLKQQCGTRRIHYNVVLFRRMWKTVLVRDRFSITKQTGRLTTIFTDVNQPDCSLSGVSFLEFIVNQTHLNTNTITSRKIFVSLVCVLTENTEKEIPLKLHSVWVRSSLWIRP